MPLPSQGTTLSVRNAADDAWIVVGKVADINGPSTERGDIDDTTLDSTAVETLLALPDNGEISLTLSIDPDDAGQQELNTLLDDAAAPSRNVQIELPLKQGHSTRTTLTVLCRVKAGPMSLQTNNRAEQNITLRATGPRTLVWGAV